MFFGQKLTDADLAAQVADGAGRLLTAVAHRDLLGGRTLGYVGDQLAHQWIMTTLRQHRPADAILSEEGDNDPSRLDHQRVWIVDPLDGSYQYAVGSDDWAVHIGLAIDGEAAVGAVAIPATESLHRSDQTAPLPPRSHALVTSSGYLSYESSCVADSLGLSVIPMGSAGVKAMAVVDGVADVYIHAHRQHEWDSCAPVAVASAAGLVCAHLNGKPLRYNTRRATELGDYLICRPEIADQVFAVLDRIR